MSTHFPAIVFSWTVLVLSGLVIYDVHLTILQDGTLTDQVYGLVFDGFGGGLLAYDLVVLRPGGTTEKMPTVKRAHYPRLWGFLFLIFGFILQIIAILIFSLPIS